MNGRALPASGPGAVLLVMLAQAAAQGAPFNARLAYEAGTGCPDAADFKAVVSARLGYDPFDDGAPDRVLARLTPHAGAVGGRLEWRDSAGAWAGDQTFSWTTADCFRAARAMGFALAVQIQLLAATRSVNTVAVAPPVTAAAPTPSVAPAIAMAAPAPAGKPGAAYAVGAGPSVGFGMSSAPVLLGRIFIDLDWPRISVEVAAQTSLPATTRRADGAGVSQQQLALGVAGCGRLSRWKACLVANAGEVRMAGQDIDRPTSAAVPCVQAGVRAGLVQRLGRRVFLSGHADGLLAVSRWTATLDHVPVWTSPRFAAALALDAGVRFP